MKIFNIRRALLTVLLLTVFFSSCYKYKALDFNVSKPEEVAAQEDIDGYPALKSYIDTVKFADFHLGAAVSLGDYIKKGVLYRMVNRNFQQIVLGYAMKHGAVVQADGSLNLDNVNTLIQTAKEAGISLYGHTLCWHSNQNATYLNGLIAPEVVESDNNLFDLTSLKDGQFGDWVVNGASASSIESAAGQNTGSAIKLVTNSNSANAWDMSIKTPLINITAGKQYVVSFFIKSDKAGKGRVSFSADLNNQYPWTDWMNTGNASEYFETKTSWQQVKFTVSDFKTTASSFAMNFDLGYMPGVTYYIDVNSLSVQDKDASSGLESNLFANSDFEAGNINGWSGWGNNSVRELTIDGYNSSNALKMTNPSIVNSWEAQTAYDFTSPFQEGSVYKLSFYIKGSVAGAISASFQETTSYGSDNFPSFNVTKDWTKVELEATVTAADRTRFLFNYGNYGGTLYIDNIALQRENPDLGTQTIEKTAEEKKTIISGALESWISTMVTNCKDYVHAWDVVNEPMDDGSPYELKTGIGKTVSDDQFYWQDYIGKDYAVLAFKLARQYGNATDKLFINDYGLESNIDKCKGLIEYVNYIESKGQKVDGIGTQMHIDINADSAKIVNMFQLLAATGKLIKISELDIGLGGNTQTDNATAQEYLKQAELYKFVIDQYFKYIPASQRYGITIWSPMDSPANSSWRAGEPIGLWTEVYVRKLAYEYVAKAVQENMGGKP
ncbi:Carbohydrate binding domain-containing protein [Arachidicoccus rhizosphaerae]|uniref:endo-1,4-beta-xylanase n=1 Tax=Arachidicoccus rhizosphaerae TaxID=551991 RepID=A0A1H3XQB4_9BACT|nr:endo-1,4-beta-xylanase [Arachidicoccus rhizosphaerae]SEA01091.1 Carbohydrate binding domain-containing protein [Arachidicoccus rhizosphaerae]